MAWVIPLVVVQQGWIIFGNEEKASTQIFSVLAWVATTLTLLWWLLGLPLRWLAEEEQAKLNDEWEQAVRGEAAKWGLAAVAICGCAMMCGRFWVSIDAGLSIYVLVNAALVAAVGRYSWLNRSEPDEDE